MGLDISYYESVENIDRPLRDEELDEMIERGTGFEVYTAGFVEQAQPFNDGDVLKTNRAGAGFRAGSYSGYGNWRRKLAKLVHGVNVEHIWENTELYKGKAFFELLNFSDCEGIIGPVVSNKLLNDFIEYDQKVQETRDEYFIETYDDFYEAFAVASNGGLVRFH
jgi:hypothetical protein